MRKWRRVALVVAAAAAGGAGCSSGASDAASFSGAPGDGATGADAGSAPGAGSGTGSNGGDSPGLPPEKKAEGSYQAPVATGRVVWIANPTSGRVAYIDAASLDLRTVEAGDGPTYLAAVPDPADDVALVLNVRSHDATLLRDHAGALSTKTFPVAEGANAWAIAPSGHWAIAWADASRVAKSDPTQGFQDLAVLDLSGARPPTVLAVGYRPVSLAFAKDGAHAYAVTQDGISVIDLVNGGAPHVVRNDALSDDPTEDPKTRDVAFTPDAAYALVRREGKAAITVVALADGTRTNVALASAPTDLTLSPTGDAALAVMRDTSTVAILPIPGIVAAPTAFTTVTVAGETIGRAIVTHDGASALLFTTAAPIPRLTVLTLGATPTTRAVKLHAPVQAVFPSDDGRSAVVLHDVTPQPGSDVRGAFSVVPLAGDLPAKIVGTKAPPSAVAIAPTSDRALVSVRDDASRTFAVYVAKMPSLEVTSYPLASPPIAVGIAAEAGRGYVAQDHVEGRITFLDLAGGQARTITGFELGARVVDGSTP